MNLNGFNGKLEAKNIEFKKLKELEINHLKEEFKIEDSFFSKSRFPNLVKLDLNNAQLSFEKMPFDDLNKLEQLRLDSNNLKKLPCESFLGLTSLKSLNLSSNNIQIRSFSNKCIQDMKKLNFLSLNSNGLTGR
jgi:Leucine-rich repeat (LRR) protein